MDQNKSEQTGSSPLPVLYTKEKSLITFPDAIKAVIDGSKVTKEEWESDEVYMMLKDGFLMIHKDGQDYQLIVSEGDLKGDDFFII